MAARKPLPGGVLRLTEAAQRCFVDPRKAWKRWKARDLNNPDDERNWLIGRKGASITVEIVIHCGEPVCVLDHVERYEHLLRGNKPGQVTHGDGDGDGDGIDTGMVAA